MSPTKNFSAIILFLRIHFAGVRSEFYSAVQCSTVLQCVPPLGLGCCVLCGMWLGLSILDSAAILHATQSFTQLFNLKRKVEDQSAVLAAPACGRYAVQQNRCLQVHHGLQREDLYSRLGCHCTYAAITVSGND